MDEEREGKTRACAGESFTGGMYVGGHISREHASALSRGSVFFLIDCPPFNVGATQTRNPQPAKPPGWCISHTHMLLLYKQQRSERASSPLSSHLSASPFPPYPPDGHHAVHTHVFPFFIFSIIITVFVPLLFSNHLWYYLLHLRPYNLSSN